MSKSNPVERYRAAREEIAKKRAQGTPDFVTALSESGFEAFSAAGFPTTKWENWKYTDVKKIGSTDYLHAGLVDSPDPTDEKLETLRAAAPGAMEIVLVNGVYRPELSNFKGLPGVHLGSLAEAMREDADGLQSVLGKVADMDEHPFIALNTAFLADGVYLRIDDRVKVSDVLHILHIAGDANAEVVSHPRSLILAGAGSEATILESFVGIEGSSYFSNAVTEIRVEEGAKLRHYLVDRHSAAGNFIGNIQVDQTANSSYESHSFWLGGELVRNDLEVHLNGSGAYAKLNGLYLAKGKQHVDNHTLLDHAVPGCLSEENYKGILGGHAHGVFNGRVLVQKDAQQTDARQSNRNLLLSDTANIDTKPQLEIYADDVKCSHGTTVGQLDDLALFYIQSRGISRDDAFHMLTSAFTEDLMDDIVEPDVDAYVRGLVRDQLAQVQLGEVG